MQPSVPRRFFATVLAGLIVHASNGTALPAEPPKPGADAESDPLPKGAVARLGSGKFRVGGATEVVFSPDGKYLAAKTYNDIIHVWDVKTGRSVRKFTLDSSRQMKFGKQGLIPDASRFSFSADGKSLVAFASANERAWQRNIETGEEEKLPGDLSAKKLYALKYSTDGKALVTIREDLTVTLNDPKTGKEVFQVAGLLNPDSSAALTFSKNSQSLLMPRYDDGAGKAVIDVIDVKTGKAIRTLEASSKYGIKHITTTTDGSKVFAIDTIHIHAWDAATGNDINDFSRRIGSPFDSFAISPDDKTIVILHGYNVVFWDLAGSKLIRRVRVGGGHRSLAISPDGKTLAVGSVNSVKILDMASGEVLHKNGGHESTITAVSISTDGKFAFTAASDRQVVDWKSPFVTLRRWDARTGTELKVDILDDTDHSFDLIYSRDAKKLAFRRYQPLGRINDFQIWNTADGSLAHKVSNAAIAGKAGIWPWKLAFDTAGKHLAIVCLNGAFELHDAEKGTELRTFPGEFSTYSSPVFSPDGKTVAAWHPNGNRHNQGSGHILFFETSSGNEQSKIAFETGVSDLRYTPDGRVLAISSRGSIHLWDVGNKKLLREIKAGGGPIAISEDSKFLATGDRYGAVEVWSIENGKRVGRREGHSDRISSIAFSSDGSRLITGSADGIAIIWDFAKLTAD
jgi:WD40 repeat protein